MELIKKYLSSNKIKPLKKGEVYELIPLAHAGNKQARDKLIIHNMPHVINITNRYFYAGSGCWDFDDLFQQGIMGLNRAIDKFDLSKNMAFLTYAEVWIKQRIGRYIEDNRGPVRVPIYLQGLKRKYKKVAEEASGEDQDFYVRLIAHQNDKSLPGLRYAITHNATELNMDAPYPDGEKRDFEAISDENQINVDQLDVHAMLGMLNDQEREILERRMTNWTLKEIASDLNLSRERIRQLEEIALFKLKAMIGNVKDNKVFETRQRLEMQFEQDIKEITVKVNSFHAINHIYAACLKCLDKAMKLRENNNKRQVSPPNWINGECDVCFGITAITNVKGYEYPIFEVLRKDNS